MNGQYGRQLAALVAVFVSLCVAPALARVVVTPPWLGPGGWPGSITHVQWEFTQASPSAPPIWNTNYTAGFVPQITHAPPSTWPDVVPGPDGPDIPTWHVDQDGYIELCIPNDPEPRPFKDILIQITSDKAPGLPLAYAPGVAPVDGAPGTIAGWGSTAWYTYTYTWHLQPNPPFEYIQIPVIESTNIEEIVVDTICYVPEPAALGVLAIGAVMLRRRS